MNLFNKYALSLVGVLGLLGISAGYSYAAAPTVDATVSANTTDIISGLSTAGITGIGLAVVSAGILVVTAAFVFWVIKHFRAIAHV